MWCMDHPLTEMLGFAWLVALLVELLLARPQELFSTTASAATTPGALVASVRTENCLKLCVTNAGY